MLLVGTLLIVAIVLYNIFSGTLSLASWPQGLKNFEGPGRF